MRATILEGNVFDTLPTIQPGSVDCVVTSPPYWMLRSYLPKNHPLKHLELGSEPTPAEYVANMVRVFSLVREAMADHATCWVNVGDTYSGGGGGNYGNGKSVKSQGGQQQTNILNRGGFDIDAGNLCLIPQRLAIALQDDGWLVRSVVVWHKPAPMPASVSGWAWRRCRVKTKEGTWGGNGNKKMLDDAKSRRSNDVFPGEPTQWSDCPGCKRCTPHGGYVLRRGSWRPTSSWEPILMLAKGPGYYADGEAVKTPAAAATLSRNEYTRILDDPDEQFAVAHDHETLTTTANLRDVWRANLESMSREELIGFIQSMDTGDLQDVFKIAAEPLKEKHYAAFPSELVHRCLKAGTSAKGYCPACGGPWVRVIDAVPSKPGVGGGTGWTGKDDDSTDVDGARQRLKMRGGGFGDGETTTLGWRPSCSCPAADPRPGLVLDPFAGSCRTGIEARRLGLDFLGLELNPDYVLMGRRLLNEQAPLFSGVE